MIFKSSILLYKTPLDSEYRNVYDDYETEEQYTAFLNFSFPDFKNISFYNPIVSRKNIGDLFEIVVNGYDSMDLHDYNYMRFTTTNNEVKFAFILSVESYNDNQAIDEITERKENASCLLHCKLDAWSNHYLHIKDAYNSVNEQRCTFDTNLHKNFPSEAKISQYTEHIEYDEVFPLKLTDANLKTTFVIWQRVTTVDKGALSEWGGSFNKIKENGFISGLNLFYLPYAIVSFGEQGMQIYNNYFQFSFTDTNNQQRVFRNMGFDSPLTKIFSSAVCENTLTTHVPFGFSLFYDDTLKRYDIQIQSKYKFYFGATLKNYAESITIADKYSADKRQDYIIPFISLQNYSTDMTFYFRYIVPSTQMQYESVKRYSNEEIESEQIYYEYPFNYKSVNTNEVEIPFIGEPNSDGSFKLIYNITNKVTPDISIIGENDETINFTSLVKDSIPITEIPVSEFLARNSASLTMQLVNALFSSARSAISSGANAFSGNIGGAISSGVNSAAEVPLTIGGIAANLYDKYRTPAKVRQSDGNSTSTPIIGDLITIKKHTATIANEIIKDYHRNGYICSRTESVFSIRRDVFDIDTGELTISALMSNEDKNEIEKAVSAGICRWHLRGRTSVTNQNRRNILSSMNRSVFNYPISLIPQGE